MTIQTRARALLHLIERFYPLLSLYLEEHGDIQQDWLLDLAQLPPYEWSVLFRLERQLREIETEEAQL